MSPITTHILDTASGKPAAGVPLELDRLEGAAWRQVGRGATDADGRNKGLIERHDFTPGTYRLRFDTGSYFKGAGFYPYVEVVFSIGDVAQHYHVPLLLSPFGYSTYRGS